ncbi:SGNH/GDSL hydrolase family protein [Parapedobacter sp.]
MLSRKLIVGSVLSLTLSGAANRLAAQSIDTLNRHWPAYIDLDQYMQPFLTADTIYDELVMPIKNGHALPSGGLLFPVQAVLSVRDTYLGTVYEEGKDWVWEGQRIVLTDSSSIPFWHNHQLVYNEVKEGISQPGSVPGTYVLFSEGELIRSKQLAVTYIPDRRGSEATKRLPPPTSYLPHTMGKLDGRENLHVVFWGNSIETGANSSGFQHVPPFMPNWTELFVRQLRRRFGTPVSYKNLAVGGKMAAWGLENIDQVIAEEPHLVVIGFGMNDGSAGVPSDLFTKQIQGMMDAVGRRLPTCEFIVITPMLANPKAIQNKLQETYRPALLALENTGVAIADMSYWHKWLLTHKSYQDMTGNNINHTNDYLSRWYAQVLVALFIENDGHSEK